MGEVVIAHSPPTLPHLLSRFCFACRAWHVRQRPVVAVAGCLWLHTQAARIHPEFLDLHLSDRAGPHS